MKNIQINSKLIQKGDIFIGIPSENLEDHVLEAISNGANLIVSDLQDKNKLSKITDNIIFSENIRKTCSILSKFYYSEQPEICVSVTGTNGKSSVVNFLSQIWKNLDIQSSSLGTVGLFINNIKFEGNNDIEIPNLTTPGSLSLHKILSFLKMKKNIDYLAFEASSHALDQYRLHSVLLKSAGFTNFASDHMDYHKNRENYLNAKLRLFREILPPENIAVINGDDQTILESIRNIKNNNTILSFGIESHNTISAMNIREYLKYTIFDIIYDGTIYHDIKINLVGRFQVMNILCAMGLCLGSSSNIKIDDILNIIHNIIPLNGRMEYIGSYNHGNIYIDYAHTSEGFQNALLSFRKLCNQENSRLITIFGCGGNRDTSKRSIMGKISHDLSDISIITDDNPRYEDPSSIRQEIIKNCENAIEIGNRKEAIKYGMSLLKKNDVLLIVGKGHETTQNYGNNIIKHNDKESVLSFL